MKENYLQRLHQVVDAGRRAVDDRTASVAPELYDEMVYDGGLVKAGTRINWGGRLKRAAVDLWDREENDPGHAPELWEDLLYREGIRVIPEVITVGQAFGYEELGWWGDTLYRSKLESNVWTPEQHPEGWEER